MNKYLSRYLAILPDKSLLVTLLPRKVLSEVSEEFINRDCLMLRFVRYVQILQFI